MKVLEKMSEINKELSEHIEQNGKEKNGRGENEKRGRAKDKMHYSWSFLSLECPRAIALYSVTPDTPPTSITIQGIDLHSALKDQDVEAIKEMGFPEPTALDQPFIRNKEWEKWFEIEVKGYKIKGRRDLQWIGGNEANVCDVKSFGRIGRTIRRQLQIYALEFLYEGKELQTWLYQAQLNRLTLIENLNGGDIERIEAWIEKRIDGVNKIMLSPDSRANPSTKCLYCRHLLSCPQTPDILKTLYQKPEAVAKEYLLLKAKTQQFEEMLKEYCEKLGNIEVNNTIVGYQPIERLIVDEDPAIEWLISHNIPIMELLMVSTLKFRNLCKKYDELTAFSKIEMETKFKIGKRGEE